MSEVVDFQAAKRKREKQKIEDKADLLEKVKSGTKKKPTSSSEEEKPTDPFDFKEIEKENLKKKKKLEKERSKANTSVKRSYRIKDKT